MDEALRAALTPLRLISASLDRNAVRTCSYDTRLVTGISLNMSTAAKYGSDSELRK